MKQLILAAMIASSLMISCSTRRPTTTTTSNSNGTTSTTTTTAHTAFSVPTNLQTSFTTQYPGATDVVWGPYDETIVPIDWDLTDWTVLTPKDYAVTYTLNGNKYYSWYDVNGNWVGTTYGMTDYNNGLPAPVNQTITSTYQGYTIDKVNQVTWKDHTAYNVKLKNGDNKMKALIDANGTVIKQKDK